MRKGHRHTTMSKFRCVKCGRLIKLNVAERKEKVPPTCYKCYQAARR